jgi:ribosome-associated protein
MTEDLPDLMTEFIFTTSRSSGPGGQNVNKVETKVEVKFDVNNSKLLSLKHKSKIQRELGGRLTQDGILAITSQEKRTQLQNKDHAVKKLYIILNEALLEEKERIATRPTRSSVNNRIKTKKIGSENKKFRGNLKGKVDDEDN